MLAEVELSHEALAAEGLVANRGGARTVGTTKQRTTLSEPGRRRRSDHGIEANTLHAKLASVESLAGGKESSIGVTVRQAGLPIVGAQQRRRVTCSVVVRVT